MSSTVTRVDSQSLGYCNRGVREYFLANGIDWQTFQRQGLPVSAFDAVKDDPMVAKMIASAAARDG
jgi:hypothetical protein